MSEIKKQENQNQNEDQDRSKNQEQANPLKIAFEKPYIFESETYNGIDLSGLEDMTGNDFINVEKMLRIMGIRSLNFETTPEGAFMYAAQAAKVPFEFFGKLPLIEARKIKVAVINFLWR